MMKKRRQRFVMDDGMVVEEHVCTDYVCKYCGTKASYCNFVGNLCLQAFVPHRKGCGAYIENEKTVGYVNECSTCAFNGADGTCRLMNEGK